MLQSFLTFCRAVNVSRAENAPIVKWRNWTALKIKLMVADFGVG